MKRIDLENNEKLFKSDYEDVTLYTESFEVGAKAWVVDKNYIENEVSEVADMVVVYAARRKKDNSAMLPYAGYYCVSGEFVIDDDIICVFLDSTEDI